MTRHGAQVYDYGTTIIVKQLVQRVEGGKYVIDHEGKRHREKHVRPGDDKALVEAVRAALDGRLTGDERIV